MGPGPDAGPHLCAAEGGPVPTADPALPRWRSVGPVPDGGPHSSSCPSQLDVLVVVPVLVVLLVVVGVVDVCSWACFSASSFAAAFTQLL